MLIINFHVLILNLLYHYYVYYLNLFICDDFPINVIIHYLIFIFLIYQFHFLIIIYHILIIIFIFNSYLLMFQFLNSLFQVNFLIY